MSVQCLSIRYVLGNVQWFPMGPIQARAAEQGIVHLWHPITDFDRNDLRKQLPKAVRSMHEQVAASSGVVYVHCTGGASSIPHVNRLKLASASCANRLAGRYLHLATTQNALKLCMQSAHILLSVMLAVRNSTANVTFHLPLQTSLLARC